MPDFGFTYPRTSSDTLTPVTEFKKQLTKSLRDIADRAESRVGHNKTVSARIHARGVVQGYRDVIKLLDNIIIEGE